jgi:class 3 adenylate cyclase
MVNDGEARVKAAYADTYDRLATLRKFDPISRLWLGQNIRPSLWVIATTKGENYMPIFMDRHDMRGLKAEDVADAHRKDIEIQDRYGVKYLAYWFDRGRGAGFCLVHAPDAATAERVDREAHGEVANAIIPVDLAAVEAFLGRIADPRAASGTVAPVVDSGLRAVMFADIVGSTEMTARLGDSAALELVRAHDALVRRGLDSHGGREVKHTGDGIMASFGKVANAVRGAADIQLRLAAYNAEASESLSVRIGTDAGQPVSEHNDLFGATVHLAHRLCSEAEADGIVVSGLVRELCEEDAARFVALGERRLKGFAEKVPVYRFEWRN